MRKSVRRVITLLLALFVASAFSCAASAARDPNDMLMRKGTGVTKVLPSKVRIAVESNLLGMAHGTNANRATEIWADITGGDGNFALQLIPSNTTTVDLKIDAKTGKSYLVAQKPGTVTLQAIVLDPEGNKTNIKSNKLKVTVRENIKVTGFKLDVKKLTLRTSDGPFDLNTIGMTVKPNVACDIRPDGRIPLSWSVNKPSVASLSGSVVTGLTKGKAVLTAKGSGKSAKIILNVVNDGQPTPTPGPEPSGRVYRGLSIGTGIEGNDPWIFSTEAKNFSDMLGQLSFDGEPLSVNRHVANPTFTEAVQAINDTFAGAKEDDVGYLYIACHGGYAPPEGVYGLLIGADYVLMSAARLRGILDQIPGRFVVMVDNCYSGDVIGKGAKNFARDFVSEFEGAARTKSGEMVGDKYSVICACSADQVALGVMTEHNAWSIASAAVARGAGWVYYDTDTPYRTDLEADVNRDGLITLREIYQYAEPLTRKLHLKYDPDCETGMAQLCVSGRDDTVLFGRT